MKNNITSRVRPWLNGLLAAVVVLCGGCSLISESVENTTPIVSPYEGAPVTATLEGQTLIITNHTSETIYHLVFPTEILAVIEWAPCMAPEVCPAEAKIDPGEETRINLRTVVDEETESLTVFWWYFLEKRPGASIPPMEINEFVVILP